MDLSINLSRNAVVPVPILFNEHTHLYDFNSSRNTRQTTGDPTVSVLKELIVGGSRDFIQPSKHLQPYGQAAGGNFYEDTARELFMRSPAGIANGTDGWFFGANLRIDTFESGIFHITRNVSDSASRGDLYATGSRNIRLYGNTSDSSTDTQVGISSNQITASEWVTVQCIWTLDTGLVIKTTVYQDALNPNVTTTTTVSAVQSPTVFPSTDPEAVMLGNRSNESSSLDGNITEMIFANEVPSSEFLNNWEEYLFSMRPL